MTHGHRSSAPLTFRSIICLSICCTFRYSSEVADDAVELRFCRGWLVSSYGLACGRKARGRTVMGRERGTDGTDAAGRLRYYFICCCSLFLLLLQVNGQSPYGGGKYRGRAPPRALLRSLALTPLSLFSADQSRVEKASLGGPVL